MKRHELRFKSFDGDFLMVFLVHGDGAVTMEYSVDDRKQSIWFVIGMRIEPTIRFTEEDARRIWRTLRNCGWKEVKG
jgi:hypothetical protein